MLDGIREDLRRSVICESCAVSFRGEPTSSLRDHASQHGLSRWSYFYATILQLFRRRDIMSDGLSSDGPSSRRAGASYDVGKDDDELMAAGTTEGKTCCVCKAGVFQVAVRAHFTSVCKGHH